jgi:hypothetical protein
MFDNWRVRRHGQRAQATVVHAQQAAKIATNDYRKYGRSKKRSAGTYSTSRRTRHLRRSQ